MNMFSRRVWAKEEDDAIRTLVDRLGTRSWSAIEENMVSDFGIVGRSGKQCRERWHNHLGRTSRWLSACTLREAHTGHALDQVDRCIDETLCHVGAPLCLRSSPA